MDGPGRGYALAARAALALVALGGAPFAARSLWPDAGTTTVAFASPPHPVSVPSFPGGPPHGPPVAPLPPMPAHSHMGPPGGYGPQERDPEDDNPFCAMPRPGAGERVVLFGSYESGSYSSVSFAEGDPTYVADVEIEPGSEPLYVVLASYSSMVWRFVGAVERVRRVVPTANRRSANSSAGVGGVGVVGIPRDRVSFLGSARCLGYFHEIGSMEHARVAGAISRRLGRGPDVVGGRYSVSRVSLPSMKVVEPGSGGPVPGGRSMGVVTVEASGVVSAAPPEVGGIMPGEAGLGQLVAAGSLVRTAQGYRITRFIERLPAGLTGGYSVNFVLAKGVLPPGGSPGHSCIVSEENGLPVGGSFCPFAMGR